MQICIWFSYSKSLKSQIMFSMQKMCWRCCQVSNDQKLRMQEAQFKNVKSRTAGYCKGQDWWLTSCLSWAKVPSCHTMAKMGREELFWSFHLSSPMWASEKSSHTVSNIVGRKDKGTHAKECPLGLGQLFDLLLCKPSQNQMFIQLFLP